MAATIGKSALLIGATGQTGQKILLDLLQSSDFTKVGEYGRRVTDKGALPASSIDKLVQRTIDFENLEEAGLKEHKWDVVFIACVLEARAMKISTLAKSIVAAGTLGSSALPASALASRVGKEGALFTLINNDGALALASTAQ
ncbi:hypothetical protein C0992_008113 [Termitomyces sp. T32_za158]|nr:hypothetical protein C0992_008113 [Termitomyces sp. T32_za158]